MRLSRDSLDHRRFWDAVDRLGEAELREIEIRIGRARVTELGLGSDRSGTGHDRLRHLIDNEQAPIAQRGKAKQKRTDQLVGAGSGRTSARLIGSVGSGFDRGLGVLDERGQ